MQRLPKEPVLFALLSALNWVYLILRAVYVPMAHDEIATFHYYVQTADFIPFIAHWDMNNHFVNSALTTLFYTAFGLSPFVLRLANLITFPLFCLYLWKTSELLPGKPARWAFRITLMMSHGFLEFFSLSRGYGMSMAFLMPVLYFLIQATSGFSTRRMMAAMGWAVLATLANLALLNTFAIVTGWFFLLVWFSGQVKGAVAKLANTLWLMLAGLTPAVFFAVISFRARDLGLLYTGGGKGFYAETLRTLIPKLTGFDHLAIYIICLSAYLFIICYAVFLLLRHRTLFRPGLVFPLVLTLNILSYWILHWLFRVNFPENRVAIYLFPLFAGALCFAAGELAEHRKRRVFLLMLAPMLFFPVQFAYSVNLSHSEFYWEDPVPVSFFNEVKATHQPGEYPPTVGGHKLRHFCWSFHDFRAGGTESQVCSGDYPGKMEDFMLADGSDLSLFAEDYTVIMKYPPNDRYLLKRALPAARILLGSSPVKDTEGESVYEYYRLLADTVDTLGGKSIYIGIEGRFESDAVPFEAWIVAEARDSANHTVCYEKLALNWLRNKWQGETSQLKNGILMPDLPRSVKFLKVYLWNMKRVPFTIEGGRVEVFEVTGGPGDQRQQGNRATGN